MSKDIETPSRSAASAPFSRQPGHSAKQIEQEIQWLQQEIAKLNELESLLDSIIDDLQLRLKSLRDEQVSAGH